MIQTIHDWTENRDLIEVQRRVVWGKILAIALLNNYLDISKV